MDEESAGKIPLRPRLVFMGTPDFAVPSLEALVKAGHDILAVVTQPDRPKGRGRKPTATPVKEFALRHGLNVYQPEKVSEESFCSLIRGLAPDLIVVVAFGQILKRNLLEIPRCGVVNIHGSLLPAYRGPAPIQWVILNNEPRTGLTLMRMDEGLDTGPILFQREVPILPDETAGHLHDRLAALSGEFLVDSLRRMAENSVVETPQDEGKASYAPKIGSEICVLDWTEPAERLSACIRALDPGPGARTSLKGKPLKLFASRVFPESVRDPIPGRVRRADRGGLVVDSGRGAVWIREVQAPGKRRMPVADFLRGFPVPEGTVLGRVE
ncbi:MAG: methionyl-tRNA formyltransferase [Deltaproteobacteria bacterium]|nr:methionyl-tRNA formyltransferase [Deltaproteobacteria bacterium]MBW2015617.1 methionyl-tRNA formyltransferase [Deltaproteobacteria bacterium]MBW2303027.1 methionyl-tRNA formyltransferase [Deltaproteobacteria bacterium]